MSGRPRDRDLELRLLAAAWSVLVEHGYESLSLSQVAARAGAHRTDVYRRWPGKAELVSEVLAEHLPPISEVDTGDLRSDLRAVLDDLALAWSAPWVGGLVGWLADVHHGTEAQAAFEAMVIRRSRPLRVVIDRAVERGEIAAPADLVAVGNLLEGPLMHRRMFGGHPLTADFLDAVAFSSFQMLAGTAAQR